MSLASCRTTVWEDRSWCPCWLTLDFEECRDLADSVIVVMDDGAELCDAEWVIGDGMQAREWEVNRGDVSVAVLNGVRHSSRKGFDVTIPLGCQADSLFAFSGIIDCNREIAGTRVKLHKQWSTLRFRLGVKSKADVGDGERDYSVLVSGTTNGISLDDLHPLEGQFSYTPEVEDGVAEVRIYRQTDGGENLQLTVMDDDRVLGQMELGQAMASAGFDWEASSLADAEVHVNMITGALNIVVKPWTDLGHEWIVL